MTTYIGLQPAYGRDYKSKSEVARDLLANRDFLDISSGRHIYINLPQIRETYPGANVQLKVRYGALRKVCMLPVSKLESLAQPKIKKPKVAKTPTPLVPGMRVRIKATAREGLAASGVRDLGGVWTVTQCDDSGLCYIRKAPKRRGTLERELSFRVENLSPIEPKSYQPEQLVEGKWYPNALRFATYSEALLNAQSKWRVWTMSKDCRAMPNYTDAPNYTLTPEGDLVEIKRVSCDVSQ